MNNKKNLLYKESSFHMVSIFQLCDMCLKVKILTNTSVKNEWLLVICRFLPVCMLLNSKVTTHALQSDLQHFSSSRYIL